MFRKLLFGLVVAGAVALTVYLVYTRFFLSDEDRIRSITRSLISNIESDDRLLAMTVIQHHLGTDYQHTGPGPRFERREAIQWLGVMKSRYVNIQVELAADPEVRVDGDTAEVVLTGRVTGADKDSPEARVQIIPPPGLERCILRFAREDGDWKVAGSESVRHRLDADESE